MIGKHYEPSIEGTPQGAPLSPLLRNILLNELDKELERRGHCLNLLPDVVTAWVMPNVKRYSGKPLEVG